MDDLRDCQWFENVEWVEKGCCVDCLVDLSIKEANGQVVVLEGELLKIYDTSKQRDLGLSVLIG